MNTEWKVIDIVTACMENNIRINFQPEKRFYRIRLKDCCGIFDMRSHCFLITSDAIFDSEFEEAYKKANNSLEVMEDLMEEFNVCGASSINDLEWRTVTGQNFPPLGI